MLGESVNIKEKAGALIPASKGIGLEGDADKTMYMVMSGDQNAGRSINMKIDNSYFDGGESKYLGTTCKYRNSMEDEIKSRLKSEFVCYQSVQNLLPSSFTYLLTYLLPPCSTALPEKLIGFQLVKQFPAFCRTRRFITALTRSRHLSLS